MSAQLKDSPAFDPAEGARILAQVAESTGRLLTDYMRRHASGDMAKNDSVLNDEFGIARAFMELWGSLLSNPWKLAELQGRLFMDYSALWQRSWLKMLGHDVAPVASPEKGDRRFRDTDWQTHFVFDYMKQSYLIAAHHLQEAVANASHLSPDARKKVDFFTRQYIDALSPSNFALTNPEVVRETFRSGGQNLLKGFANLLEDIERGGISMTDESAFEVGKNVAASPGKVVFQTDLMQLIQFAPSTREVYRRPLLIIPPWINKYYILDLREDNSFIRWAVSQGHTVFVISWVNPDAALSQKSFDDYMVEGPLAALDAIEQATGEREVNLIGYCLGGTLLGCVLAWMAQKRDQRAVSATFFTALLDFSVPGELGVFIDDEQVQNLERRMNERGYLEGAEMARTFNILRANDLVWSFVVHNYLLGREPFPFDLLYWNSDSTRMPARMHSFYLRNMYLRNALTVPGGITLGGEAIDLSKVKLPAYFVSTAEDHISPWLSTYKGARLLGGPTRFVLGGSGHIAGVVNPPSAKKYGYCVNERLAGTAEEWRAQATQKEGSWWTDWQAWIAARNGDDRVPARVPGKGKLKAIEDAPGSYVRVKAKNGHGAEGNGSNGAASS